MRVALAAILLLVPVSALAGEKDAFEHYVQPLHAEAAPILSPPLGAVPRTELWGSVGLLYGKERLGRATYRLVATRLVVGGEWSPGKLDRLGIGASLVAFQTTHTNTDLPPAIDEWRSYFDLGPLRLHARFMALRISRRGLELGLTPFLRLVLPTDTSRIRESRDMPIRRVLDDRVLDAPYVLVEPGVSFGITVGPASLFTHQGAVLAPIHGEAFHFLWSMHYGVGVDILGVVDVSVEIAGLLRPTRAHQEDPDRDRASRAEPYFMAFGLCPGVRLKRGALDYELAARIGLTEDALYAYGDFTIAFTVTWVPGRKR
jgi:hypothetical protein